MSEPACSCHIGPTGPGDSRRPSTISLTEIGTSNRWPGRSVQAMYPVSSPFYDVSMRAKHTSINCQRISFAAITMVFVVAVVAVYLLATLPAQGIPLIRLSSKDAPSLRTNGNTEEILRPTYAVGYYDVRGMHKRFVDEKKSRDTGDKVVEPSDAEDQAYLSYVRLVNGARDLRDFLVASFNSGKPVLQSTSADEHRWLIVAHSLRYTRSLELLANKMAVASGTESRAKDTMRQLQNRVWTALERLQNPADCRTARALRCKLTNPNGLAASIHDVLHCLITGLQKNRTVILDSTEWHYTKDVAWDQVLKPLSACEHAAEVTKGYPEDYEQERVHVTILPESIASTLMAVHGDPFAWFLGMLTSYILRPAEPFYSKLKAHVASLTPSGEGYLGIHIRRTDKSGEAHARPLESYMAAAEEFFEKLSLEKNVLEKRVYVATDEPSVIKQLREQFKTYTFLWNEKAS